ncbi:MAG: UxaA family hydrolase, partial [Terracidiphilus sp.]
MAQQILKLDPRDNAAVALVPMAAGTAVECAGAALRAVEAVPAKHKIALTALAPGDAVYLYGMVVGEAVEAIPRGGLLSTRNVRHRAAPYSAVRQSAVCKPPDASAWRARAFAGYH